MQSTTPSWVMPRVPMEQMRHESIETTMKYHVGQNAQSTAAVSWSAVGNKLVTATQKQNRPTNRARCNSLAGNKFRSGRDRDRTGDTRIFSSKKRCPPVYTVSFMSGFSVYFVHCVHQYPSTWLQLGYIFQQHHVALAHCKLLAKSSKLIKRSGACVNSDRLANML